MNIKSSLKERLLGLWYTYIYESDEEMEEETIRESASKQEKKIFLKKEEQRGEGKEK